MAATHTPKLPAGGVLAHAEGLGCALLQVMVDGLLARWGALPPAQQSPHLGERIEELFLEASLLEGVRFGCNWGVHCTFNSTSTWVVTPEGMGACSVTPLQLVSCRHGMPVLGHTHAYL